jgi:hypothetical protein
MKKHNRIETWLACASALAFLASTAPARAGHDDDEEDFTHPGASPGR